ncbi:hypothetical protein HHI36_016293 [Cryptolaemus montrouzieri]|uniref:Uncharacterized protein n=1 Tax=Cryptolaemus montrouzieri TaxID=559131 RepID=A0ABD2NJA0_9CUCU
MIGTWNIRSLNGKETELNVEFTATGLDVLVIVETKKKSQGEMELEGGNLLLYSGVQKDERARRWKEYFMEHLGGEENNTEGEEGGGIGNEDGQITSRDEVAEEQITNEEIVEAFRKIKLLLDVTV